MRPSFAFLLTSEPFAEMLRFDLTFQLLLSRLQPVLSHTHFIADQAREEEASVAVDNDEDEKQYNQHRRYDDGDNQCAAARSCPAAPAASSVLLLAITTGYRQSHKLQINEAINHPE